tara:strand:+ start:757 stop:978 length:222 start_codon:yes stop_codon:yes gene_type:complete
MRQQLAPFAFTENELWDAVIGNLQAAIDVETASAVSSETKGEDRIHQCGRSEGLQDFKEHIESLHAMAMAKMN